MKRIILMAIAFLTIQAYGQLSGKAEPLQNSKKVENTVNDTIPLISYVSQTENDRKPAFYLNGKFVSDAMMKTINSNQIDNLNVDGHEIVVEGKKYGGRIYFQMKKGYHPKLISLADLKLKYTNLTNAPCLFMIDNEFVSGDYNKCLVDEKFILQISVEKINHAEENLQLNVIRLLTRTEANVKKSNEIMIRGTEDITLAK
jgi:hypothetical protein